MTLRRAGRWIPLTCLILAACVDDAATSGGREVKALYDFFFIAAAVVFTTVAALIGWSIVRYRKRSDDETLPEQFHTNVKLEVLWFAIPTAIVIALFIASAMAIDSDQAPGEPEVEIRVEAFQWGWRFTYGDDVVVESLPDRRAEVVLPAGRSVEFELTSADVIHSFYVPSFLLKRDVVPGRTNSLEVVIEEPGDHTLRCAEFCGLLHDQMDVTLRAVPESEFAAWLTEEAS